MTVVDYHMTIEKQSCDNYMRSSYEDCNTIIPCYT